MSRLEVSSSSPGGPEILVGATKLPESGYNLPMMDRQTFDLFDSVVRGAVAQGRKKTPPYLKRITVEKQGFTDEHTAYLMKENPLGCTLVEQETRDEFFEIWLCPNFRDSYNFRLTLAHELTHGYVGVGYLHGAHWRRWYYRVLKHLDLAGYLNPYGGPGGDQYDSLSLIAYYEGIRYVKKPELYGKERTLLEEAFAKAEAEHGKVRAFLKS